MKGLHLELSRVGYAGSTQSELSLGATLAPTGEGNRVEYGRGAGLTEWYVNGPLGLEQGFTLNQAWPGTSGQAQGQPLELELKLSGVKAASLNAKGDALAVTLSDGRQLNYGQLYVYDAHGQTFPASFGLVALSEGDYRLTIAVSGLNEGVTYPLTVDPLFTQSQVLTDTTTGATNDYFGTSVALSSDGNTALIGAYTRKVGANTQ